MKPLIGAVIPGIILCIAAGFGRNQWMAWQAWRAEYGSQDIEKLDTEVAFRKRQILRRLQMSGLLGVLALSMWIGQLIPRMQWPTLFVVFWCVVALMALWLALLAVGELVVVRRQGNRLQRQLQRDRAALQQEAEKLKAKQNSSSAGLAE